MLLSLVHYVDVALNDLDTSVKAKLAGIEAQVVISHVCPLVACVSLIISAALTVNLLNLLFGFLAVIAADLHGIVDAGFLVSPDVNSQHIGSVSKDKIRTPSDDDAGSFFICQVLYDLCLEVEKIFLRGKIGSFRSDNITVIDLYLFEKSRLCFSSARPKRASFMPLSSEASFIRSLS